MHKPATRIAPQKKQIGENLSCEKSPTIGEIDAPQFNVSPTCAEVEVVSVVSDRSKRASNVLIPANTYHLRMISKIATNATAAMIMVVVLPPAALINPPELVVPPSAVTGV